MKLCFVLGTRPEIIKLSPVIREAQRRHVDFFVIHTNQHYSANMDSVFFKELHLPIPSYNLDISGESSHTRMTARMMEKIEKIYLTEKPDVVVVQGDTNSTLAGALSAEKLRVPVAHVEAGLRSYDQSMPEEYNRIVTDHISTLLFTPTKIQKELLIEEGIPEERIYVTGNTIVDVVKENLDTATSKGIKPPTGNYILLTMHRPSNVDDKSMLNLQIENLTKLSQEMGYRIVCPLHPRTKKQLELFGLSMDQKYFELIEPVGYFEMLIMEENAKLIATDSGGLQEEACILKIPCITLRNNTERPETVIVGSNILTGSDGIRMIDAAKSMMEKTKNWTNPYGKGDTGKLIIDVVTRSFQQ